MKFLNSPNDNADWGNDLLSDLTFIKENKRYPLNNRTFKPAAISAIILAAMGRVALLLFFNKNTSGTPVWVEWLIGTGIASLILTILYSYYKALQFETIKTKYDLQANLSLLQKFFTSNNLAFTRHDDAPEVFMIISRNLNADPNREFREVMVFIADDQQILINSHFTGSKFSITPPSRNYRKMSKMLQQWLDKHINKSNITDVSVQQF